MSESALRIADIPLATITDFRPVWQDAAGAGPYVVDELVKLVTRAMGGS